MTSIAISLVSILAVVPQAAPPPSTGTTAPAAKGTPAAGATAPSGSSFGDLLLRLGARGDGSGSHGGRFTPPDGDDVLVSPPDPTNSQYFPTIAVDPTDRLHLFACASDQGSSFYASFDGGLTWSFSHDDRGAPSIAFGPNGEIYVSTISGDLFVGRSFDGGLTTTNWVQVTSEGGTGFIDAATLAIDRSGSSRDGTVYVSFTDRGFEGDAFVWVATSSTDGASWSKKRVSDAGSKAETSSIAVDGNGVVGVVYYDRYNSAAIWFDHSSDGGATFGRDVKVAAADPFNIPNLRDFVFPTPRMAIDTSRGPYDGTIYVVWSRGASDGPDVVLSSSSDHGATWTTPIVVNDVTTNSQFTPSIAVDPQGNVVVAFYDARDSATNQSVRLYESRSSDGGKTFQKNVAVSDVGFPLRTADAGLLEARTGIDASDRMVHAIWTDVRNGDLDIYTSTVALDFSTDVASISAAIGGTVTFTVSPGPLFLSDDYFVLGSLSGTSPGIDFFFENVPVNYDNFTLATIVLAGSSIFPGFAGTLDANGAASAQLVSGPLPPSLVGVQMDFASLARVGNAVRWGSSPTHLEIVN